MLSSIWPVAGAIAGLIAGSFLATLVLRWPNGRSLGGRSKCDACGVPIGAARLVPLASYVVQRGRCHACGGHIVPLHPAMEVSCAALGATAFGLFPGVEGIAGALFGWLLITLAALDWRHFWLPDVLTGSLAVAGAIAALAGVGPHPLDRLVGGAVGLGALALIAWSYRKARGREGLGGGDPKFFGAIGLWLGWQPLPFVLLGASVLGLLVVLAMRVRGLPVDGTTRLPFGTLLAVAAFPAWLLLR